MFSEPLLAHPAKIGGVRPTWHSHPGNDHDRDQRYDDPDDEQHVVRRIQVGVLAIVTRGEITVCALVHMGVCDRNAGFTNQFAYSECTDMRRQPLFTFAHHSARLCRPCRAAAVLGVLCRTSQPRTNANVPIRGFGCVSAARRVR